MAMEVTPPKQLHKHALPIVMVAAAVMVLPLLALSSYNTPSLGTETIAARGLVTRIIHVKPQPNGLAKITFSPSAPASNTSSNLPASVSETGRGAQLLIAF